VLYGIYSLYQLGKAFSIMRTAPIHTPTSVGALIDPVFLKRAVDDTGANTTDAEEPEAPSTRAALQRCARRLAAALSHLLPPTRA